MCSRYYGETFRDMSRRGNQGTGSHCALVALICARVFVSIACVESFVFPLLCFSLSLSFSIASSLSLFIVPSVNNAASAASCALFAVR